MGEDREETGSSTARANRAVMLACVAFTAAMVGTAYAAVPLYQLFCQATGYDGTPRRAAANASDASDATVTVRFDANVSPGLALDFAPVQRDLEVRLGETAQAAYRATNRTGRTLKAQALYNVTPTVAGAYFNKIDCFCFTETTLAPGETKELPIVFFVDPAYLSAKELKAIRTLTLSYSYFAAADDTDADRPAAGARQKI